MKVYLDTCSIQRPLDTLDQTRLRLEAEAVLGILEHIISTKIDLISSTVLELENARNPFALRREHGQQTLTYAQETVFVDDLVEARAQELVSYGITAIDAVHLAAAEKAYSDYFCTCDDHFLRRTKYISSLSLTVLSPLDLIEVLDT